METFLKNQACKQIEICFFFLYDTGSGLIEILSSTGSHSSFILIIFAAWKSHLEYNKVIFELCLFFLFLFNGLSDWPA